MLRLRASGICLEECMAWFCDRFAADRSLALLGSGYRSGHGCPRSA
jgi:hypothetical protein